MGILDQKILKNLDQKCGALYKKWKSKIWQCGKCPHKCGLKGSPWLLLSLEHLAARGIHLAYAN